MLKGGLERQERSKEACFTAKGIGYIEDSAQLQRRRQRIVPPASKVDPEEREQHRPELQAPNDPVGLRLFPEAQGTEQTGGLHKLADGGQRATACAVRGVRGPTLDRHSDRHQQGEQQSDPQPTL